MRCTARSTGRTERDVEQDIYALAKQAFGVKKHWHKRIVRSGRNTVCILSEEPPVREIGDDDTVFLDLGPVFDEWEASVGRTYVMGSDPEKHRLCQDLPRIFDAVKRYLDDHQNVTGTELYALLSDPRKQRVGCSAARSPVIWWANSPTLAFQVTATSTESVRRTANRCAFLTDWGRRSTGSSRCIWSTAPERSAGFMSDFWCRRTPLRSSGRQSASAEAGEPQIRATGLLVSWAC
jgi:hypothetical protein